MSLAEDFLESVEEEKTIDENSLIRGELEEKNSACSVESQTLGCPFED